MLDFGVPLLLLLLLQSRDRFWVGEPGISRVDVVLLFRLISSVVLLFCMMVVMY